VKDVLVAEWALPAWLLERIPAISDRYATEAKKQYGGESSPSAYFVFSFVLKLHLEALLRAGDHAELRRIFDLLETLANHGDADVQSGLDVTMEEMDVAKVALFLGPKMTAWELERVAEYPHGPGTQNNRHVDGDRYRQRWREEIDEIGGLQHLTLASHLMIRHELVTEFGIVGMIAPQPGSREWLEMRLPWPYSKPKIR
jgi:hypothetical protein